MAAVCRVRLMWHLPYLDVLGYLDEIPVCVGYEIDGEVTTDFPTTATAWRRQSRYSKTLPGWKCDIRGIKKYEDLPENCRKYIEFVEKQIGYPDHHGLQRTGQRGYHLQRCEVKQLTRFPSL